MSAVAIPVFMPVAAADLGVPPSFVGIFVSLIYLGATVSAPISGYFISRFGPIGISQICLVLCALGLGAVSIPSLPMMIIGTVIMGIGYGPVTPASSHLLVRTTPVSIMSVVFQSNRPEFHREPWQEIIPHLVISAAVDVGFGWPQRLAVMLCPASYRNQFDTEKFNPQLSWKRPSSR
jgi:hypothetical protein